MAPALILLAPFVGFIRFHDYGLWRPESLLCAALLVGFGLVISGFIALRPAILRPAVIGLLLAFFVDLQLRTATGTGIGRFVTWELVSGHRQAALTAVAVVVALSLMTVTWLLRRHLGAIVSSGFGVIVLTGVLLPMERIPNGETHNRNMAPRADLPPVIHLVLDGQIGLEGLPPDIPGGTDLRRALRTFYEDFGFTVFGRAYSGYTSTYESLSNLVNGQMSRRSGAHTVAADGRIPRSGIRLRGNAWFRALSQRGYRIRVYHTDYLDFCTPEEANVDYCFVSPSNSIHSVAETDLGPGAKAGIILSTYLSGSLVYRIVANAGRAYARLPKITPKWLWEKTRFGALAAVSVPDRIAADLRAAPRGTAFFAHLMIPHGAYVFDRDCRLRTDLLTWLGAIDPAAPAPFTNTPGSRAVRYRWYFDQVRCVHRKLAALFAAMKETGVFEHATIVVHGDHGSRIALLESNIRFADRLSETDLIDNHSTLFAVRAPGLAPGYDRRPRSIQHLFAEIVLDRRRTNETGEIYLTSEARKAGRRLFGRPMPEFGE
ncbi:MAG: hypothetical protein ACE5KF_04425 [Kiloniellaceae bacterium]